MSNQDTVEIRRIVAVIRRWLWLIVSCTLLAAVTALAVTSWMPPVYNSTATLLVQPAIDTKTSQYNALAAGERLALTYGQMLKGRPVLEAVISRLELEETPGALADKITVDPIPDTQLIRLTVRGASPEEAALIANTVSEVFIAQIEMLQAERYTGSLTSMQENMETLRAQIEENQSEMDALNATRTQEQSELDRLESLMNEYRSAYRTLQQDYESLHLTVAQLTDNVRVVAPAEVPVNAVQSKYTATATLLIDQSSASGRTSYSANTYGQMLTGRPVLEAAIAKLQLNETPDTLAKGIRVQADSDTQLIRLIVEDADPVRAALLANTITEAFVGQIQVLLAEPYAGRLATMQEQMDEIPVLMEETQSRIDTLSASTNQAEADLARLEGLLAEQRSDYRTLQQDLEQLRLTAADAADAVVITEQAQVAQSPVQHRMLYTALAAAVGMVVGTGLAFLLEHLDDRIRTHDDVSMTLGLSTLGVIGQLGEGPQRLVMEVQPTSYAAETFRVLATNIRLSSVERSLRTLVVTSPSSAEGKSTIVANLAMAMAGAGLKIVAVDADLRRPRLHRLFELEQGEGLTGSLLKGTADGNLQPTQTEGLRILTSGHVPPNPAQVVGSRNLLQLLDELTSEVDLVLIDSPPVLAVADTTILAAAADGVLLVLQAGRTPGQGARNAAESLRRVGAHLVGAVLNAVPIPQASYNRYYEGTDSPEGSRRRASAFSRLSAVGWIVASMLALVLVVGTFVVWLSGRGTSAAAPPADSPEASLVPAAVPTATATVPPTWTALPTAMPSSTPTTQPSPVPCTYPSDWMVYLVRADDTLPSLAARYDVSVAEIIGANCMSSSDVSAGQILYLPLVPYTPTPTPSIIATESVTPSIIVTESVTPTTELSPTACVHPEGWTAYVVQTGDSLSSLGSRYGVSVDEIMEANCLTSSRLSAGRQGLYLPPLPQVLTPTPVLTSTSTVTATSSTTLTAQATAMPFSAPVLIAPSDRQDFSENAEVVLSWKAVGELPPDTYYVITVAYSHLGATWYDEVPWTQDTSWTLSGHRYLLDLSDDGEFRWSVRVMRQTGVDADGKPTGVPLSPSSEVWSLIWKRSASESERTAPQPPTKSTPSAPPP